MTEPVFPLHRPELAADLEAGDRKLERLIPWRPLTFSGRRTIVAAEQRHDWVYKLRSGWCARVTGGQPRSFPTFVKVRA